MSKVYYCIQVTIVLKELVVCIIPDGVARHSINYMCNKHYKETIKF